MTTRAPITRGSTITAGPAHYYTVTTPQGVTYQHYTQVDAEAHAQYHDALAADSAPRFDPMTAARHANRTEAQLDKINAGRPWDTQNQTAIDAHERERSHAASLAAKWSARLAIAVMPAAARTARRMAGPDATPEELNTAAHICYARSFGHAAYARSYFIAGTYEAADRRAILSATWYEAGEIITARAKAASRPETTEEELARLNID